MMEVLVKQDHQIMVILAQVVQEVLGNLEHPHLVVLEDWL
jgi:hypothetical protein